MIESTALIKIETTAPSVTGNFDEVKAQLQADLERYKNVVVTEETLPADKKLAQQINKRGGEFKRLRIDKEKELSAPIREFGDKMKSLESLCTEVSNKIKEQVAQHEQKRLNKCADLLAAKRDDLRKQYEIQDQFYMAEFDDLIKLGSLTKSDALTKGATDTLDSRVKEELQFQQRVDTRLVMLENACLKAGMSDPLTKDDVSSFLYQDDATYEHYLSIKIESEVARQQRIKEAAKQEAQAEAAASKPEPETEQAQPLVSDEHKQRAAAIAQPEQKPTEQQSQHPMRTLQATFEVPVPAHIPDEVVHQKLRDVLKSAGITSLTQLVTL